MRTLLYALLLPAALLLFRPDSLSAQHYSFRSPQDSIRLVEMVERYLAFDTHDTLATDTMMAYAVDEFAQKLAQHQSLPIRFPMGLPYRIESARAIRSDGLLALVAIPYTADSVPLFGRVTVDWILFARLDTATGAWRISAARQLSGLSEQAQHLDALDRSGYPPSLKKVIAAERSRMLMSNEQMRKFFNARRAGYDSLAKQFRRSDSLLRMVARTDRVITQLNTYAIYWGAAAEQVPPEAVDEYLKKLDKNGKKEFREQLRFAEKQRRNGYDTLARVARKIGIKTARLDSVVTMMRELGVIFATSNLPWKGTVQLTIGGTYDDVLGFIYAPQGELPLVSPEEYFFLEDLGGGWWIFRST